MKVEVRVPTHKLKIDINAPKGEDALEMAAILLLKLAGWNIRGWIESKNKPS